jgi:hypothetical protein
MGTTKLSVGEFEGAMVIMTSPSFDFDYRDKRVVENNVNIFSKDFEFAFEK